MRVAILGSTGMLGQALVKEANYRKMDVFCMADKEADFSFDIRDDDALSNFLYKLKPEIVINTIAIVNLRNCESDPALAYLVNARPVGLLSKVCQSIGAYFIHISTDHYYTGDKKKKHSESDNIVLVNEYARTKYVAEIFALSYKRSLVIRTNIVGFRYQHSNPTFVEWIISALNNHSINVLFSDFYISSIDVRNFSKALFDLIETSRPDGVLNIASSEVFSKSDFSVALGNKLNLDLDKITEGSVFDLKGVKRAESLGLNVDKAENLLGYSLPKLEDVIESLVVEYNEVGFLDMKLFIS